MAQNDGISRPERIPVTIERATAAQAQAMAQLKFDNLFARGLTQGKAEEEKAQGELSAQGVERLAATLSTSNDDDHYLVAKNEGELVGYCRMTWRAEESRYQFRQFYVDPKYAGKGIGSQVMAAAKKEAEESPHKAKGMFLYVGDYNDDAQKMYEHWGFRRPTKKDEGGTEVVDEGQAVIEQMGHDTQVRYVKMVLDFQTDE